MQQRCPLCKGFYPLEIDDTRLPESKRTQANLWKAKFFEMRMEVARSNKGMRGGRMYNYEKERNSVFEEDNQMLFIGIRENVKRMLSISGAFTLENAVILPSGCGAADSFTMLACVDRLVELGEIIKIHNGLSSQGNVYISVKQ